MANNSTSHACQFSNQRSSSPPPPLTSNLPFSLRHTYTTPIGTTKTWESSQRLTRPATSTIDGVGIVAILTPGPPLILLQKQFRPPIDAVCIEVPAGLMDEGETPEECALRELREETGYTGVLMGEGFVGTGVMWNGELSLWI